MGFTIYCIGTTPYHNIEFSSAILEILQKAFSDV